MNPRVIIRIISQIFRIIARRRSRHSPMLHASPKRQGPTFPFAQDPSAADTPAKTAPPNGPLATDYPVLKHGLPPLQYSPQQDGSPDPGEVVWAWVPYEEDPTMGKDRPVLILCRVNGGFLGLHMTSTNHSKNREREAAQGRYWLNVGHGSWDSQGRDSEVRVDRVLFLPEQGIRREGAALPRDRYDEVAQALVSLYQ